MERLELASLAGRSDAKDHVARAAAKQYTLTTNLVFSVFERCKSFNNLPFNMVAELLDANRTLCLVCIYRHEPHVPLDASALERLSNSGQILSVDSVAKRVLSVIHDGW